MNTHRRTVAAPLRVLVVIVILAALSIRAGLLQNVGDSLLVPTQDTTGSVRVEGTVGGIPRAYRGGSEPQYGWIYIERVVDGTLPDYCKTSVAKVQASRAPDGRALTVGEQMWGDIGIGERVQVRGWLGSCSQEDVRRTGNTIDTDRPGGYVRRIPGASRQPTVVCTAPSCKQDELLHVDGPGACDTTCVTKTPAPVRAETATP